MNPLTDLEKAEMNSAETSPVKRVRLYAQDLRYTAEAYAVAADAPGLPKAAARYLYSESMRLINESGLHFERADELEAKWSAEFDILVG